MTFRHVVVVGSGFGGAVMASRIGARAGALGASVLVLEKGDDPTGTLDPRSAGAPLNAQGNRFRQSMAPDNLVAFAELHSDRATMNVIGGKGLGGGSLVYDGVSLRAPTDTFEQRDASGRRLWPALYSRASLGASYDVVESKLRVRRLGWTDADAPHGALATKRDWVFAEGCRRIGAAAAPLKVADDGDANEGWWNQGQRFAGRQSLFLNYLADAHASGVEMWSGCEVERIERGGKGWILHGTDRRGGAETSFAIECAVVVVAAGAVASTALLLRSKDAIAGLDPHGVLGKYVSSNGDYGVTGVVGADFERDVEGHKGKPMSSFCPTFWQGQKFILIPFYTPPLFLALGQPSTLLRAADPRALGRSSTRVADGERAFGLAYKQRLATFGSRMLTMGCLALDACEGEIALGDGGAAIVRWRETDPTTEARWKAAADAMRRIYEALGGEMFLDGYRKDGVVSTAHPLGGCRMSERGEPGVVDACGEAFGAPNLFVVDGAIVPSALGVNPSLTIAAVAESIAARLLAGTGTTSLAARLAA